MKQISASYIENERYLDELLTIGQSFDIIKRKLKIGGHQAFFYFVDGFCKDELMQKILQYFLDIKPEEMPKDAHEMSKGFIPYVEVEITDEQ